jgi:hypothetical protein
MYRAFAVNYDLKAKESPDYAGLFEALKASPNWWHYLESTWLIITEETATQVWNRISNHVHKDDRVLIIEVRDRSQGWLPEQAWDWIDQNVPPASAA